MRAAAKSVRREGSCPGARDEGRPTALGARSAAPAARAPRMAAPHYNALWRSLKALRLLTVQMSFAHSFRRAVARDELVLLPKLPKKYI